MDSKVLAKIYKVSTSLNESVETIDNNLAKILKIEVKEAKELKKERKEKEALRRRKEQLAKRKEKEVTSEKEDKQIEEEKKGLADTLKGALGGLVKGLGGLLKGLSGFIIKPLSGLFIKLVGPMIGKAIKGVFTATGGILKKIVVGLGTKVLAAITPAATLIKTGLGKLAASGLLAVASKLVALVGFAPALAAGAGKAAEAVRRNSVGGGVAGDAKQFIYEERLRLNRSVTNNRNRQVRDFTPEEAERQRVMQEVERELNELHIERNERTREITVIEQTGTGRSGANSRTVTIDPEQKAAIDADIDSRIEAAIRRLDPYRLQTGGMVPTLLEPGEKVFTPGTWGPAIQQMNDVFSRFQTGGVVQASHAHTGAGYSPGQDYQGRPAVFSKGAAEAFAKMMAESNGAVKTSDINSSKRSADYNEEVGGVSNSNHLTGNAADIQTGSSSWEWIKKNGSNYGWKFNNYMGPNGWHFDYSGSKKDEGLDDVESQLPSSQASVTGSNSGGKKYEDLRWLGGIGGFIDGLREGLAESGLGEMFSSIGGGGGGIMNLFGGGLFGGDDSSNETSSGNSGGGGGGSPVSSAPSPGGAFSEKALIAELDRRNITNKNERAMFLAQMAHETGNFRFDEEIADGSKYEGRSDLGNTQAGDGKRFKGRGYIQLTGRANYKTYGDKLGIDLVNNPERAKDPNTAAAIAFEYWSARVNREAARQGDVRAVTYNINGGYNGLTDRQHYFDKYSKQKLQQGGIVDIGGVGFGDKIPMNLPEGSFVLNKKASAILNGTLSGSPQAFLERMKEAQDNYNSRVAEKGSGPVVIVQDEAPPNVIATPEPDQDVPNLPNGPSMIQAAEYFYHLSLGGNN